MWVRGLKRRIQRSTSNEKCVAPRVGAWIETQYYALKAQGVSESHPVWVRGLKPYASAALPIRTGSHPVWVRGLKLEPLNTPSSADESHPVWVRGLKHRVPPW